MKGVVNADTHIAEPAAMSKLIDEKMAPRQSGKIFLSRSRKRSCPTTRDGCTGWMLERKIISRKAAKPAKFGEIEEYLLCAFAAVKSERNG